MLAQKIMLEAGALAAYGAGWKFAGAGPGRSPESAAAAGGMQRLWSAHQMGTCRMGRDPATSVANPWGEVHSTPGLWIGDASAFPSASGTNPMATIMALARRTAHAVASA